MAGILATLGSFAQTTKIDSAKGLMPNAKSFTTELNVNLFNGQVNFNNSLKRQMDDPTNTCLLSSLKHKKKMRKTK